MTNNCTLFCIDSIGSSCVCIVINYGSWWPSKSDLFPQKYHPKLICLHQEQQNFLLSSRLLLQNLASFSPHLTPLTASEASGCQNQLWECFGHACKTVFFGWVGVGGGGWGQNSHLNLNPEVEEWNLNKHGLIIVSFQRIAPNDYSQEEWEPALW